MYILNIASAIKKMLVNELRNFIRIRPFKKRID